MKKIIRRIRECIRRQKIHTAMMGAFAVVILTSSIAFLALAL